MMHFITKAKQTEKDLRARFADDKFAEWEAQVIDALDVDFSLCLLYTSPSPRDA